MDRDGGWCGGWCGGVACGGVVVWCGVVVGWCGVCGVGGGVVVLWGCGTVGAVESWYSWWCAVGVCGSCWTFGRLDGWTVGRLDG
jgi:hypothetical protein